MQEFVSEPAPKQLKLGGAGAVRSGPPLPDDKPPVAEPQIMVPVPGSIEDARDAFWPVFWVLCVIVTVFFGGKL